MPRQAADARNTSRHSIFEETALCMKLLFDGDEQLADAEQSHHRDDEVHALHQLVDAHGQAHAAGDRVDADGRNGKADRQRDDVFIGGAPPMPTKLAKARK